MLQFAFEIKTSPLFRSGIPNRVSFFAVFGCELKFGLVWPCMITEPRGQFGFFGHLSIQTGGCGPNGFCLLSCSRILASHDTRRRCSCPYNYSQTAQLARRSVRRTRTDIAIVTTTTTKSTVGKPVGKFVAALDCLSRRCHACQGSDAARS